MKIFRSYFLAIIGLAILSGSLVLSGSFTSSAKNPDDVTVVNTPGNPVPTQAQGTTAIAGTVQAQQSGNWTVGITGTPTFNVGNTAANAVLTRDVDNPARHPFQFFATFSKSGGNFQTDNQLVAPAGKRLVIETVTAQAFVPTGQRLLAQISIASGGGTFAQHNLVLASQGGFDLLDYFAATEAVRLYADQGSLVQFRLTRSSNDSNLWGGSYSVSGYAVKAEVSTGRRLILLGPALRSIMRIL